MSFLVNNISGIFWAFAEVILCLIFFVALLATIVFILRGPLKKYKPVDMSLFSKLKSMRNSNTTGVMRAFSFVGKHDFLIPLNILLIFSFLFFGSNQWYAYRLIGMSLSSLLLMIMLKQLFKRKRPLAPIIPAVKGKSFPSGHAIIAVNFYGLLLYTILQFNFNPSLKMLSAIFIPLLIFAIGFSRVYLQVHYASDVLAGFIIGICWFFISLHILNRLEDFVTPRNTGPAKKSGTFQSRNNNHYKTTLLT